MPGGAIETYKGEFANEAAIVAAYATANLADYAWNIDTASYWYWNDALSAWANQEITDTDYLALSAPEKAAVPYIIVV